jgi:hypothetical protein
MLRAVSSARSFILSSRVFASHVLRGVRELRIERHDAEDTGAE